MRRKRRMGNSMMVHIGCICIRAGNRGGRTEGLGE